MERLFSYHRLPDRLFSDKEKILCHSKQNCKHRKPIRRFSVCAIPRHLSWPQQCKGCSLAPDLAAGELLKTAFIMILICNARSRPAIFLRLSSSCSASSPATIPFSSITCRPSPPPSPSTV